MQLEHFSSKEFSELLRNRGCEFDHVVFVGYSPTKTAPAITTPHTTLFTIDKSENKDIHPVFDLYHKVMDFKIPSKGTVAIVRHSNNPFQVLMAYLLEVRNKSTCLSPFLSDIVRIVVHHASLTPGLSLGMHTVEARAAVLSSVACMTFLIDNAFISQSPLLFSRMRVNDALTTDEMNEGLCRTMLAYLPKHLEASTPTKYPSLRLYENSQHSKAAWLLGYSSVSVANWSEGVVGSVITTDLLSQHRFKFDYDVLQQLENSKATGGFIPQWSVVGGNPFHTYKKEKSPKFQLHGTKLAPKDIINTLYL